MLFTICPYRGFPVPPSRTTLVHSKAKARCGISRVPAGDSPVIFRCEQGDPLTDRHAAQLTTYRRV